MMKWNNDKNIMDLTVKIANRYLELCDKLNMPASKPKKLTLVMDIDACHSNGCPLKLEELLNASDFDFAHDVGGIITNINRETGKLENCFVPRYAVNQ